MSAEPRVRCLAFQCLLGSPQSQMAARRHRGWSAASPVATRCVGISAGLPEEHEKPPARRMWLGCGVEHRLCNIQRRTACIVVAPLVNVLQCPMPRTSFHRQDGVPVMLDSTIDGCDCCRSAETVEVHD